MSNQKPGVRIRCIVSFGLSVTLANAIHSLAKIDGYTNATGHWCAPFDPFPKTVNQVRIVCVLVSPRGCNKGAQVVRDWNGVTAKIVKLGRNQCIAAAQIAISMALIVKRTGNATQTAEGVVVPDIVASFLDSSFR